MAEVRVTKEFKDNFDTWAADRIHHCNFTPEEIDGLKAMLRIDFAPGPDQLRAGLECLNAVGATIPATIDDHEERYRMWSNYFAAEADEIRNRMRKAA